MLRLKREESEAVRGLKESQYEELMVKDSQLEKRMLNLEQFVQRLDSHVSQTVP